MSLAAAQRAFLDALYAEHSPQDARLAIYHRSARANWHAALAAAYPVVRRLVGEAFFAAAAERYARAWPSASGDLGDFGGRLADFLAGDAPAAAAPYLADVARLEWALHEAGRAPEAPRLDLAAMGAIAPARHCELRLRLDPAARLLRSSWPVAAIWEANQPSRDGTPERAGPECVLVARPGGVARPEPIDAAEWALLRALGSGVALKAACAALGEHAPRLPELLARHAASGVICGFDLPG